MIIKILDKKTMGYDIPFEHLKEFGKVIEYDYTAPENVKEVCADASVIILNKVKITDDILSCCKQLKLICVFATGYDNIDIDSAKKYGVGVCNVPAYSTDSVALFTLATVLSLSTRLAEYTDYVRSGEYSASGSPNYIAPVFNEIRGKTWGIIGLGNIGKAVANVASALGAKVIANKRTKDDNYTCVDIKTLCKESDIITVHTPLTQETKGLINKELIEVMKPGVILVNEARGAVLNEHDVAEAVKHGKIKCFGCDVYSTEPFDKNHPYNEIKNFKNVILTPHSAWSSYEARMRCSQVIYNNIKSFLSNESLNRVDK